MLRLQTSCWLIVLFMAASCSAQEWADKMFETRSHDFGTVARGAKAEYAFQLTNLYLEEVHIASVRTSCGCTTPRIENETLKTYEKGAIIAHINSESRLGQQGATLTVTIDRPFYAEVQLNVKVYVYSDVLLEPASVVLGSVWQGNAVERTIRVRYTGQADWQVLEVRSGNPHLTGTVRQTAREVGSIAYDLKVVLDKSAPAGYANEYIWLITNDPYTQYVPIPVEGQVQAAVSVSPTSLFLGVVQPGQSITRQIAVQGQRPFRITSIRADSDCLKLTIPKEREPKTLYLVPITFIAPGKAGPVAPTIQIETDLGKSTLRVPAYGVVGGQ
jgi:hypothetical protein